ncbi:MAG: hypothetical protein DSY37_02510 [Hyperthermus sp.]|nr:MAG: hypothetical protein DSY37_02510 [Hyperthermus sp.]
MIPWVWFMAGLDCHTTASLLLDRLRRVIGSSGCDCIALSGGIDTSVLALAARLENRELQGFIAFYTKGVPRDLVYARLLASSLLIDLTEIPIDDSYIVSRWKRIVECTGRRNHIELRNDVVFMRVLEAAQEHGCGCTIIGDGGDELFAGYSFMLHLLGRELYTTILNMAVKGRYPGVELAECIGVKALAPFLSDDILEVAFNTPMDCVRGGGNEGKSILRLILSQYGLKIIAERPKTPAEAGSGTAVLSRRVLEEMIGATLE